MKNKKVYYFINNCIKNITSFLLIFSLLFSLFTFGNFNVFAASVKTPTLQSVTANSATSITIKWKKLDGVKGYVIYQKLSNGDYKKIATLNSGSTVSYTKKSLSSATKYSYKIKAFKTIKGNKIYSSYSTTKSSYTKPATPNITSIKSLSSTSLKISWRKVSKAKGYVVYQKTSSGYKKIATIKSGNTTSYSVKGLKSGKKYTFVVSSYFKPSNSTSNIYSVKSTAKSATTNKVGTMVWIPTKGGKKYHSSSKCSNMKSPEKVTKSKAIKLGFGACAKCYK